jgi:integrase
LMSSIRPWPRLPQQYVFPSECNGPMEYHNFQSRHWKPIIEVLAENQVIDIYLPQSHTRHTFITLALAAGMDVNSVAYLTGNSPKVIYEHYASRQRVLTVPEF